MKLALRCVLPALIGITQSLEELLATVEGDRDISQAIWLCKMAQTRLQDLIQKRTERGQD